MSFTPLSTVLFLFLNNLPNDYIYTACIWYKDTSLLNNLIKKAQCNDMYIGLTHQHQQSFNNPYVMVAWRMADVTKEHISDLFEVNPEQVSLTSPSQKKQ